MIDVLALLMTTFLAQARVARTYSVNDFFESALQSMNRQDYAKAERILLNLIRQDPSNGLYWFNLGSTHFNLGEFSESARAFQMVISLKSPLAPAAHLSLAKCYRKLGKLSESLQHLKLLQRIETSEDMTSPIQDELSKLNRALIESGFKRYDSGDDERAAEQFDQATQIDPAPRLFLMKGIALLRSGKTEEAKKTLRRVEMSAPYREIKEQARFFLQQAESRETQARWWLFLDGGIGGNSNVFLDGNSQTSESRFVTQFLLGAGFDWARIRSALARMGYAIYWEETPGLSAGRFLSQALRGQVGYEDSQWSLKLLPSVQHQILETQAYALKPALGLEGQRSWRSWNVGVLYEFGKNYSQESAYRYLNGNIQWVKLHVGYEASRWDVSVFYHLLSENIGDLIENGTTLPLKNLSHGPGFKAFWSYGDLWEIVCVASYLFRDYRNLGKPGNLTRQDNYYSGYVKVSRTLSASLRLFGSVNFILNKSTLGENSSIDDKNYLQAIALTGLSWDILN